VEYGRNREPTSARVTENSTRKTLKITPPEDIYRLGNNVTIIFIFALTKRQQMWSIC